MGEQWFNVRADDSAADDLMGNMLAAIAKIRALGEPPAPDKIRVGGDEAWEWMSAAMDRVCTHRAEQALPYGVAARMYGLDVVLDPNIPGNQIRIGDTVYLVAPDRSVYVVGADVLDGFGTITFGRGKSAVSPDDLSEPSGEAMASWPDGWVEIGCTDGNGESIFTSPRGSGHVGGEMPSDLDLGPREVSVQIDPYSVEAFARAAGITSPRGSGPALP